ncbi:MAG: sialidase family protein [Acidobacteriota bacterium]
MRKPTRALVLLSCCFAVASAQTHKHSSAKNGKHNPFVASDNHGGFYLLYVERANDKNNLMLRHSTDGRVFSAPSRVNNIDGDAMVRNENPPKLAVAPNGELYACWGMGASHSEGNIRFARSTNGGKTFSPAITLNSDARKKPAGHAFQSIAVDKHGRVYVVWIDERNKKPGDRGADIWMATSENAGKTFSPDRKILSDICECCRTHTAVDSAGRLFVAYRTVPRNGPMHRDILVARSDDGGKSFTAKAASQDVWEINGCPVAGPSLSIDSKDQITVVWFTGSDDRPGLYYVTSTDHGATYSTRKWLDADQKVGKHAQAIACSGGVFVAWDDEAQKSTSWGLLDPQKGMLQKSAPFADASYPTVAASNDTVVIAGMLTATADIFWRAESLPAALHSPLEKPR